MNPLEKQLQSWTPRRPSAKIARRLFSRAAPATVLLRRTDVWHWLTPVAACVMAMMVVVHGSGRRLAHLSAPDKGSLFATLILNGAASNADKTLLLSKMDENVEWNVWTHLISTQQSSRAESPGMNIRSVLTNR
jgi:hypothetical protein